MKTPRLCLFQLQLDILPTSDFHSSHFVKWLKAVLHPSFYSGNFLIIISHDSPEHYVVVGGGGNCMGAHFGPHTILLCNVLLTNILNVVLLLNDSISGDCGGNSILRI